MKLRSEGRCVFPWRTAAITRRRGDGTVSDQSITVHLILVSNVSREEWVSFQHGSTRRSSAIPVELMKLCSVSCSSAEPMMHLLFDANVELSDVSPLAAWLWLLFHLVQVGGHYLEVIENNWCTVQFASISVCQDFLQNSFVSCGCFKCSDYCFLPQACPVDKAEKSGFSEFTCFLT